MEGGAGNRKDLVQWTGLVLRIFLGGGQFSSPYTLQYIILLRFIEHYKLFPLIKREKHINHK